MCQKSKSHTLSKLIDKLFITTNKLSVLFLHKTPWKWSTRASQNAARKRCGKRSGSWGWRFTTGWRTTCTWATIGWKYSTRGEAGRIFAACSRTWTRWPTSPPTFSGKKSPMPSLIARFVWRHNSLVDFIKLFVVLLLYLLFRISLLRTQSINSSWYCSINRLFYLYLYIYYWKLGSVWAC